MGNLPTKNIFDDYEISKSKEILNQYAGNAANNNFIFKEGYEATYDQNYSYLSLKRSRMLKCHCDKADFSATSLTGSTFQFTKFTNCNFEAASLDFCLLYKCSLYSDTAKYTINNANLGNSNFVSCKLKNIFINKSTAANALFEGSKFEECHLEYSSFENSIFRNCQFKNMAFRNLNIEFVEFSNCKFEDVVLPFAQIPYTFGLLECIKEHSKTIKISSTPNDEEISSTEYFKLLPQLIPYYVSQQEYFPVANIYLAFEEYEKAFSVIFSGIQKACFDKDFRMLKYFCKLSIMTGWCNRKNILRLYNVINDIKNFEPLTDFERHNYYQHLGEFRKILLFSDDLAPTLYLQLETNILPDEKDKVSLLIKGIDDIIASVHVNDVISTIELRHESPYFLLITIIGTIYALKLISEGFHSLFKPIIEMQEIKLNQQKIELNNQEIAINQEKINQINVSAKNVKDAMDANQITLHGKIYFINCDFQKM